MEEKRLPIIRSKHDYKLCTKCGERKLKTDFYKNMTYTDELNSYCKDCTKESARKSRATKNRMGRLEIEVPVKSFTRWCRAYSEKPMESTRAILKDKIVELSEMLTNLYEELDMIDANNADNTSDV